MKIKKVEQNKADYPKSNEVSEKEIKKKIPKKVLALGALGIGAVALVCGIAYHKSKPIEVPLDGVLEFTDDIVLLESGEQNSENSVIEEIVE